MHVVKHSKTLEVENSDVQANELKGHSDLLPSVIRCLITGPSDCGKTNVIIALIEHANGLHFENINIYSKSLHQPKYTYLENLLKPIKSICYRTFSDGANIITPGDVKYNTVFIFDDIACDKQDIIREYFSMGRHKLVDCFYLCQAYTRIPKHLIRDNANLLILFIQDNLNLKHVYTDHVGADMSYEQFRTLCSYCWGEKYGFLVINNDCNLMEGRYRKGFDNFIILDAGTV